MSALALAASVASFLGGTQFWVNVGLLTAIFAIFTFGLQLNVGYTGLYNFAQAGFMAVGAYAMALLILKANFSFWLALPVASAIAVGFALVVGMPSLRLRGDYFAIASIAFSQVILYAIQNASFTGGEEGLLGYDSTWQSLSMRMMSALGLPSQYYLVPLLIVSWGVLLVVLVLIVLLSRTPWGRVLRAIREDEDAARALGKRVFVYKLQSLSIAAVCASIAGYLLALDLGYLSADEFTADNTFIAFTMLLVGGLGSYLGVILGAVVVEVILEMTRNVIDIPLSAEHLASLRFIVVGALLVVIVMVRPQGILGKRDEMISRR
jgi:branched-chain amino acid transport system permease protein